MDLLFFLILLLFCLCFNTNESILDLKELNNFKYGVEILNTPVEWAEKSNFDGTTAHMKLYTMSRTGQRFECQLPKIVAEVNDFNNGYTHQQHDIHIKKDKDSADDVQKFSLGDHNNIAEILQPMESYPCLFTTKGWWTYEFCFGKDIKQYHKEDGKILGNIIYLGFYENETEWESGIHNKNIRRNKLNRYHSHYYVNGTACDVINKMRESEVRFMCAEGEGDSIFLIEEPATCSYIITIHTTRICHHPFLKPPISQKPNFILCFPALNSNQYLEYTIGHKKNEYSSLVESRTKEQKNLYFDMQDIADHNNFEQEFWDSYNLLKENEMLLITFNNVAEHIFKNIPTLKEVFTLDDTRIKLAQTLQNFAKILINKWQGLLSTKGELGLITKIAMDTAANLKNQVLQLLTASFTIDIIEEVKTGILYLQGNIEICLQVINNRYFAELRAKEYVSQQTEKRKIMEENINDIDFFFPKRVLLHLLSGAINELFEKMPKNFEEYQSLDKNDKIEYILAINSLSDLLNELEDLHIENNEGNLALSFTNAVNNFMAISYDISLTKINQQLIKSLYMAINKMSNAVQNILFVLKEVEVESRPEQDILDDTYFKALSQEQKDKLSESVLNELEIILAEAEREVEPGIYDKIDMDDTVQALTSTLKSIIENLGSSTTNDNKIKKSEINAENNEESEGSIKVKITKLNLASKNDKQEKETELYDSNHRKIEEAIKEQLENIGISPEGKVEIKIITYDANSDEDDLTVLSEEESSYFKNMILGVLGSGKESLYELERQEKLENNYNFNWKEEKSKKN